MTDITILAMRQNEFGVDVSEGYTTTSHWVGVTDDVVDTLGIHDVDRARLVRESIAVFLEHEKATSLPEDLTLRWIADRIPTYYDEIRARLDIPAHV